MIVNKNTTPDKDLYYLGGRVIGIMDISNEKEFDYFFLFAELNKICSISMNLFALVLDWLFILGVIKNSSKGKIERCF